MGGKVDYSVVDGPGPFSFRISGSNYHSIGTLLPRPNCKPTFAQLYIYDTEDEEKNRISTVQGRSGRFVIDEAVVLGIKQMLDSINPYVKSFRYGRDFLSNNGVVDLRIRILQHRSKDARQYNLPTTSEVDALMVGDGSEDVEQRDIVVCTNDGHLQRISECHPSYMALQYPLLFPYGEDKGKTLIRSGSAFQQFVVDAYAAIEEQRLLWVRRNQNNLRTDLLRGLQDAIASGDHNAAVVGRRMLLPSTFTGGPRYMAQSCQDAMAICQWYGPPDLFITFTCNSKWEEVTSALKLIPGQRVEDRPDIVARVFNIKKKQLINDLREKKVFGRVIADIHVVEFQKRGLPHAHILITLAKEDKIVTQEDVDAFISAEIPDKDTNPEAYEIVLRSMIHGPCSDKNPNSPCMVKDVCTKNYLKSYKSFTTIDENGFPVYRQRKDGRKPIVRGRKISN
ncbi:uncharacterized protein LOC143891953 [Tasmannia lanceolata]|uniref:uncharacterized protein LOC143891953 n=1 Tax=Tasmannia lanceolata TaxID=3420 RepID=UPI004062B82F